MPDGEKCTFGAKTDIPGMAKFDEHAKVCVWRETCSKEMTAWSEGMKKNPPNTVGCPHPQRHAVMLLHSVRLSFTQRSALLHPPVFPHLTEPILASGGLVHTLNR